MNDEMKKFWVITKEIYKKNVKSPSFLLVLLGPIFMAVVPVIFGYLAGSGPEASQIELAIVSEDPSIRALFVNDEFSWDIDEAITTEQQAEEAILNEDIDAYVIIENNESVQAHVVQMNDVMQNNLPVMNELLSNYQIQMRAAQLDLVSEELGVLLEPVELTAESIRVEEGQIVDGSIIEGFVQSFFVAIMTLGLFMLLSLYAGSIIQEIAVEKGTRIMEIILSMTSATTHFFGKLIGILSVLATQFVVYIILAVFGVPYIENLEIIEDLFEGESLASMIRPTIWYVVLFFVIGLFIYSIFAAFLGSLTSKVEDAGKMMAPIQTFTFIGLYGGLYMLSGAEHTVTTVLSYIPFFTPFMMPMRIVHEQVGATGILLSIIGSLVFMGILLALSLYFYRTNVLVYSEASLLKTVKQSWSILRSNQSVKKA